VDLLERGIRADGYCEVSRDEFERLLEQGAIINGIRNLKQGCGRFKTQCRIEHGKEGQHVLLYFDVFTEESVNWANAVG
jgi:hypothetical protein